MAGKENFEEKERKTKYQEKVKKRIDHACENSGEIHVGWSLQK